MQKKFKGILLFSKIFNENDLFVKFLSNSDELISGLVYGGLSKKRKNIYQVGFFLDLNILYKSNKPPSINAELSKPYMSSIITDKYKLNCLLSTISLINLSIIEGQKINNLYNLSENFLNNMILSKNWLINHLIFLFNLLKLIGYEIDYSSNSKKNYFNLENLNFEEELNNSSVKFPHILLNSDKISKRNYNDIVIFFKIFETVFIKNHLSNLNLQLPNQYHLFKKQLITYFKN